MTGISLQEVVWLLTLASLATGLVSGLTSMVAAWAVIKYRMERLDKAVFGNGAPGILERLNHIDIEIAEQTTKCDTYHRPVKGKA
jgi:hypothetical protein